LHPQYSRHMEASAGWAAAANGARRVVSDMPKGTCKQLGAQSAALGGPLEGWRVASKRLAALPRTKWVALGRGCGRKGSGAQPLPRAAAVSTGERVRGAWVVGESSARRS